MSRKCIGCGITLQSESEDKDGYTPYDDSLLCQRCFKIKNYGEYKYSLRTNIEYSKILDSIMSCDLVIYVSSILNLDLDFINKFTNCILVLTKRDILPGSVKDSKIIKYVNNLGIKVKDVMLVSSIKNYNLDNLYSAIIKYNSSGRVYLVGNTNSGKSTLLNCIIKNYTNKETNIVESMYPSTTLDMIEVDINNGLKIIDTPGIIVRDSITNFISAPVLKKINIKKEIKPITYQLKGKGSILIDNLVRIDFITSSTSMTIYGSNRLSVRRLSSSSDILLSGSMSEFNIDNNQDIVIYDLLFIKFTKGVNIRIYTSGKYRMFMRDALI